MSLQQFQRAFADLVASPNLCVRLPSAPEMLDVYDLTERERVRLLAMASHRGMSHNCTLYRANRLTPIARCLPRTCLSLGGRLRDLFDAYLAESSDEFDLQFRVEAERFGRYLHASLSNDDPVAACLEVELAQLAEEFASSALH
jgi:hypothetical protein